MKKLVLLILIFYPIILFSQIQFGTGSSGDPYRGLVTTPWSISGDNYYGDLTVSSGTLTINPGSTLRFGADNSITFSGTGALSAVGNSSNYITFTAANTAWGHLAFDDPSGTGSSSFSFCIIEKGSVTGSGYSGAGGGILIRQNNLIISNSIIRNNSSDWGGGIFVDAGLHPDISNCLFKDNTTIHGGGAIYCWNGVSSIIVNCIFDSNHCTEPTVSIYSGGAVTAQTNAPIQIINCTFVQNTSTHPGDALLLYGSDGALVENCIFWGSSGQIAGATNSQVVNCAIEGSSGYTNTVTLTNSGATGPNFIATDGSNWSIQFISPCRDAGTSSGAPSTDYIGNSRIGNYDIGAYEVQYLRWNGATSADWSNSANWDGNINPNSGTWDVIIPSGLSQYPTGAPAKNFTIGSGKTMILNPGAQTTLSTLTNNGTLKLESDASGISSLIVGTLNGTATVELYLTGATGSNLWHYISSPLGSLARSTFAPSPTLDLACFVESLPSGSTVEGWIGWDGWNYNDNGNPHPEYAFDALDPGYGYNYLHRANFTYSLSGTLNTSTVSPTITYSGVSPTLNGYNLLGNPFSSGLDWDAVAANPSYPATTSKAIYFTRNNTESCSYVGGVGIPGDVNGYIPPMQGFFIKTTNTSTTLPLLASARVHIMHDRYKGSETLIPLVRLSLTENNKSDEAVVRFNDLAKTDFDYDFDALKMFISASVTSIYSSMGGINYSINGQPFPQTFIEIPIVVNLVTSGNHSISTPQLQGLDNYDVTLTDKTTGFVADLKTTPSFSFSASAGSIADRFVLKIGTIATRTENPVVTKNTFNIYPANNTINIQTISDEWNGKSGSVKVLDLTGKTVSDLNNSEFSKNSLIQVAAPGAKGIYVVEMKSGVMRYVGKVVIK